MVSILLFLIIKRNGIIANNLDKGIKQPCKCSRVMLKEVSALNKCIGNGFELFFYCLFCLMCLMLDSIDQRCSVDFRQPIE